MPAAGQGQDLAAESVLSLALPLRCSVTIAKSLSTIYTTKRSVGPGALPEPSPGHQAASLFPSREVGGNHLP